MIAVAQRFQVAIAPARLVGDEDNPAGIADQQGVATLAPFAFQLGKLQFHHHGPEELAIVVGYGAGEEIARNATGDPNGVKTPGALGAGLAEVGTKTVVVADVAAGQAPVARRHGQARAIQQLQGRGFGGAVDFFQFAVQFLRQLGAHRAFECVAQLRVECQHRGQGAVAFDQGMQGGGIQRQLLIGTGCVIDQ
ncbi:hypothetical protein D3C73_1212840 [compost metagenome]